MVNKLNFKELYTLNDTKYTIGTPSTVGKLFWCVAKHFDCLRDLFYKKSITASKNYLVNIRADVIQSRDPKILNLYNTAINNLYRKNGPSITPQEWNLFKPAQPKTPPIIPSAKPTPQKIQVDVEKRVTIGTYNILFPQALTAEGEPPPFSTKIGYSEKNGKLYENSPWRFKLIEKNLADANLDIVCIQEVKDASFEHLSKSSKLQDYEFFWTKHSAKPTDHGVGILYNKHKFKVLNNQEVNLKLPAINAVTKQIFNKSRSHLVLDLQDIDTKKVFRVVSCHMQDPRDFDKNKKDLHVQQVVNSAEAPSGYKIDMTIVAGDMNQDQFGDVDSPKPAQPSEKCAPAFQPFIKNGYQVDGDYSTSEYDKDEFGNGEIISKERHIDWIWVKGGNPRPVDLPNFDNRGSDHRLVASTV